MSIFLPFLWYFEYTNHIELSDEYEKFPGFFCPTDGRKYRTPTIIEAKTACDSDRSCVGFTALTHSLKIDVNTRYVICENSSSISYSKNKNIVYIKRNNAGNYSIFL